MKNLSNIIILSALTAIPATGAYAQQDELNYPDSVASKVNVAFKTVDEEDLMGGVSTLNMVELTQKNYATYSLENMQSYIGGYTGELWNMGDCLVLVDGVPRDADNVMPTEIEQITFMKAASAVILYGSRAAKGAILITTKRGRAEGLQVSLRGNASLYVPKRYPKYLGSAEYMTLYNEALENDGYDPVYSDEDIYNYASGKNPYRYPDINFFSSDYLRKTYQRYEGVAEFTGGGKYAHFYTNIGLYHLNDLIDFGEGKDNHTTRLNVRGNIDLVLNDWVTGWVNANVSFYDSRSDNADYWSSSATLRPTSQYPLTPLIPISYIEESDESSWTLVNNSNYVIDGKYILGGTQDNQTNPFAAMYAGGYTKYTSRQLQFDAGINLDLRKITPGLSFKFMMAIDYSTSYNTSINNEYATYEPTWNTYSGTDLITSLTKYGTDSSTGTQEVSDSYYEQTILFSGQFDYTKQINKDHNINASLIAHGYQESETGEYHRTSNVNLGIQATYNYQKKYYLDFSGAAVHSAKLASGHRNAFSPSVTAAWRISKEKFMENADWLDDLKINLSYAVINEDLDIEDYYMYDNIFTATGTWWGWSESANSMQTSDSQRGENEDLGFVKRKEFRAGIDASFFDGQIKLNANFFTTDLDGLLTTASNLYPNYFTTSYPESSFLAYINYNIERRKGVDFTLNMHHEFGEVDLGLGVTGLWTTNKNVRVSESVEYDWLATEGARIDAIRGYECLGFFQTEEEVAESAVINSNTQPGDLKYKDQNGDGVIDSQDEVVLGHYNPDFYLGINFTAKWRDFTFFLAGTGSFGGMNIKNSSYYWVYGDGKYSEVVRGRWTAETAETATYPRLTTEGGELNFVTSDFWTYDTTNFTLEKVQITYDFPKSLFARTNVVKGLSVYLSGSSLFMIAKERKHMETNVGSAPQTRCYNLGVKINL